MRTYSRGQLVFIGAGAVLILIFLLMGFGVISIGKPSEAEAVSEEIPQSEFIYQTNTIQLDDLYSVSDSNNFSEDELENIKIYEMLNEAVVNITTEVLAWNWFFEQVPQEGGTGSGSIIDKRGYILTNYHVVESASKVFVNLADGSQYEGEVIGKDRENDLAVIKFDPNGHELKTISFGNSASLKVGQKALAIGNPFGYDRTLTTGIVSGLGRPVRSFNNIVIQNMIQTDASINPGNSGGPLLDSKGQMIGINTMIYSPSGGSVGIGFAVPVDTARRVVPDLINFGYVNRGWISISPIQIDTQIARAARLPVSEGILVSTVDKNKNADKAGIRGGDLSNPVHYGRNIIYLGGDIIIEVDGQKTPTISDFISALEDNKPGETISVTYLRGSSKRTVSIVLDKRPEELNY